MCIWIICNYKKYGDWGLGIGDCPIPNPQSPIPNPQYITYNLISTNNFTICNIN